MEDIAAGQNEAEYLAGTCYREPAVKLALRDDLLASVVTYDGTAAYELEMVPASPPPRPVVIDRSQPGGHCHITLERWLPITDEPGLEGTVNVIHAILAASARTDPAGTTGASVKA